MHWRKAILTLFVGACRGTLNIIGRDAAEASILPGELDSGLGYVNTCRVDGTGGPEVAEKQRDAAGACAEVQHSHSLWWVIPVPCVSVSVPTWMGGFRTRRREEVCEPEGPVFRFWARDEDGAADCEVQMAEGLRACVAGRNIEMRWGESLDAIAVREGEGGMD